MSLRLYPLGQSLHQNLSMFSIKLGQTVAWLTVLMAIVVALIVALRVVVQVGSVGAQESVTYMHAIVIMCASAFTLAQNGHVRVDIFYRSFTSEQRAWVNLMGSALFLLPLAVFIVMISWNYMLSSWSVHETSADAGGIPAVFLLKTLIPLNGVLLFIQCIADIIRNLLIVSFKDPQHA